jgi:hypothetical protein
MFTGCCRKMQALPVRHLLRLLLVRVLYTVPVLWLVVSVVFLLIHLVPGDPLL